MKVRIKYCGGCNPRYDRRAVVERLRAGFPEDEFVEMVDEGPFDRVIVICGCSATCASHEDLHGLHGKTVLSSDEEYAALCESLREIPE